MNRAKEFQLPKNIEYLNQGLRGDHLKIASSYQDNTPSFIIIGAAKAGTTSLVETLKRHEQIRMSNPKEPKFFGRNYYKGWDWYAERFGRDAGKYVRGEASTMYSSNLPHFEHTARLMKLYLPEVKLIYLTRHPLARMISHWRHRKGLKPSFVDFNSIGENKRASNLVIGCSKYFERITPFREQFGDSQILPLTLEDMEVDPAGTLKQILEFISVDSSVDLLGNGELPKVNTAENVCQARLQIPKPEWDPQFKKKVIKEIQRDTHQFLKWMGKPSDFWNLKK